MRKAHGLFKNVNGSLSGQHECAQYIWRTDQPTNITILRPGMQSNIFLWFSCGSLYSFQIICVLYRAMEMTLLRMTARVGWNVLDMKWLTCTYPRCLLPQCCSVLHTTAMSVSLPLAACGQRLQQRYNGFHKQCRFCSRHRNRRLHHWLLFALHPPPSYSNLGV